MTKYYADLLIFDLDGTLVDSQYDLAGAVNAVRREYGMKDVELPVIRTYIGDGVGTLMERALPGITADELTSAITRFKTVYGSHLLDQTALYPGVRDMLAAFPTKHKAVLTNKTEVFARMILDSLGLGDQFEVIWGGDTSTEKKPSPEPIRGIIRHFGGSVAFPVMIGDGVNDIRAARAAGIASVAVCAGYTSKEALIALSPDFVIEQIDALPGILE